MTTSHTPVTIITGATTGIGKATKELLRSRHHRVYNLDIHPDPADPEGFFIPCDVSQRTNIRSAVEMVFRREQQINHAFINAGIHLFSNMENTTDDEFDHLLAVNIAGSFYTAKYIISYMKQQGKGSIVFMGSDQSIIGKGQSSVYGLTKGAVGQLTKSTAIDYAPFNIRVNCICPGTIQTPLLDKAVARYSSISEVPVETAMEGLKTAQPLQRIGRPEEIAAVVAFLLSDESSFMTGALVSADGGYVCQ